MNSEIKLGRVQDLDVTITPLGLGGTVLNVILFTLIGRLVFGRPTGRALAGGLALTGLHWFSEVWHNVGHATAARQTGHPMEGIRLGYLGVLGTAIYPEDEPELPAHVHLRRAAGGPIGSAVLTGIAGVLSLLTAGMRVGWVPVVFFLDNLLVFTLGALLPLGFTDGSTIYRWMGKREAS